MEVSDRPKIRKYYKLKMQKNLNKKFYMIFEFEKYINNINLILFFYLKYKYKIKKNKIFNLN